MKDEYKRKYVIVCNEYNGIFCGALLFWGHRTQDDEERSFGGYASNIDSCELYAGKDLKERNFKFTYYHDGMTLKDFLECADIVIRPENLEKLGYKQMRLWYRP